MSKKTKIEEYDSEPVTFCSKCYSLNIRHDDSLDLDCCGECGCTDFRTSSVEEWENLYKNRFGHKFIEASRNIRNSPIFLLSMDKLKSKVYNDPSWREICNTLYPTFPEGLSRADSIILLFAKLAQENRIDELKIELINRNYKK